MFFLRISLLFAAYSVVRQAEKKGGVIMFSLPWWIYLVVAGIIFSGYMTVRTAAKEREIDEAFVEKEGEIYMERIRKERERRQREAKSL